MTSNEHSPERKANRLIHETSPYLLQHAHNPVDWYPWGDEALERARNEDKPIFLSIGYSACHWCHVMEHESFENQAIADFLNRHFISIKVDREERPDLDDIYMTAVQMLTGSGGWPMTVFLTPDLQPFFGGTYFAPDERYGRVSFPTLLERIHDLWTRRREDVLKSAQEIAGAVVGHASARLPSGDQPTRDLLDHAAHELEQTFDPVHGGFGDAPKFPPSAALDLLLRQYVRTGSPPLLKIVVSTLGGMGRGGIYDQLGGGFHRYAVDARWLVPHFEKMLYDQALIVPVYLSAFQVTRDSFCERVARATLDYILRDLRDPAGGIHSSEDADSEGREGKFYVWSRGELMESLGTEVGEWFCAFYGVSETGNFEGANILHVAVDPKTFAESRGWSNEELEERLADAKSTLLAIRSRRARPHRDDKVIVAWNGLAITALARGAQVLRDARYGDAAVAAAGFIRDTMMPGGDLFRVYRDGKISQPGYLDDYACFAHGLVDLYEATFDPEWLALADRLAERMAELFWDPEAGNFYFTSDRHTHLLARSKPGHDGSEPSGNSVAAAALQRLGVLLDRSDYLDKAEAIFRAYQPVMQRMSRGMLNMLCGLDHHLSPRCEIALAGDRKDAGTRALLDIVHQTYVPNKVVALADGQGAGPIRMPLLEGKQCVNGRAAAYVCSHFTCREPAVSPQQLREQLESVRR